MNRLLAVALAAAISLSASPAAAQTSRTKLLDLTADTLAKGEFQINLFWARFGIGVTDWLELSTEAAGDVITLFNATAKARLLNRPELRLSAELGGYWFALGALSQINAAAVPAELRASVPLAESWEVELAASYRYLLLHTADSSLSPRSMAVEASLVRYDSRGAFYLQARLPLFSTQAMQVSNVLGKTSLDGSLTLDNVAAWSVFLGRDLIFGKKAHLRAGLGYVRQPGILVIDSYGNVLVKVDLYWR